MVIIADKYYCQLLLIGRRLLDPENEGFSFIAIADSTVHALNYFAL